MILNNIYRSFLVAPIAFTFGCGGNDLDSNTPNGVSAQSSATVVQVESAAVSVQDGIYSAPSDRKVDELLPQKIDTGNTLPYPLRTGFDIKSLQTDFWPNRDEILSANVSGVVASMVWANWQPTYETNCSNIQIKFDGVCFTVDTAFDNMARYWSSQGKTVTAVLFGVPDWARITENCDSSSPARALFCSARNPEDFGRFAALMADRYNGFNGHGRIADFVIHNEVNMNQWYNIGCGAGVACDQEKWIADYSANFNVAYDRITAIQPAAKVFIPFAHQFDVNFDDPAGSNPIISVKTFIRGVNSRAQNRKWRMAYHPYHRRLDSAEASFNDLPRVTFGNLGVLAGWLRQEFPFQPEAWQVHLTENGVSSNGQSDEYSQDIAVCNSYRNVLGTPGMENYIYHRMHDHHEEFIRGGGFGLRRVDGSAKPVWETWANMSGRNGQRNNLDCGFENLPYTKITSSTNEKGDFRASSRVVGDRYWDVQSWFPLREYEQGTYMAYECTAGDTSYISTDVYCDGNLSLGPVGYFHELPAPDRVPLFTCSNGGQVFSSDVVECGTDEVVEFIGYVKNSR